MLPESLESAVLRDLTFAAVNSRDFKILVFLCCFAYKRLPAVSLHICNYSEPPGNSNSECLNLFEKG